ncbi:DUF2306 domain-containing protein [Aeromicrobium sp. CTD01-1L150]|uniref:DUF2306 domain-containing protein n=1 Tax=Aeromicrobium sp. CTD01-1L150 TaxID=3341830 RepID=UPI0035C1C488
MDTSPTLTRREWLLVGGLLLLALVPSVAGGVRIGEIATGASQTPQNARFLQMPLPIVVHVVAALVYSVVGAFQFLPSVRRWHLAWHRFAGRFLLVPAGLIVAASGLWMTALYQSPASDGTALTVSRYVVGGLTLTFTALGVSAIVRRDVAAHGAWMLRAYALAMGAGTQVLTSGPFLLLFGPPDVFWRVVQMDAGWIINVVVAEWIISRRRTVARRDRAATVTA